MPPWEKYGTQSQPNPGPWEKYSSANENPTPANDQATPEAKGSFIGDLTDPDPTAYYGSLIPMAREASGARRFAAPSILQDAFRAFTAPARVLSGEVPPQNLQSEARNAASLLTMGRNLPATFGATSRAASELAGSPAVSEITAKALAIPGEIKRGVADAISMDPEAAVGRKLLKNAQNRGMNTTQVEARIAELGPNATLADALPELAEGAVNRVGPTRTVALDTMKARQDAQGERVVQALEDKLTPENYSSGLDALSKARTAQAAPLYAEAFNPSDLKPIKSELVDRLMTRPVFQQGLKKGITDALDEAAITGQDPHIYNTWLDGANLDDPNLVIKQAPTLRMLDAAKRGLDSILSGGGDEIRHPITGQLTQRGRRIDQMRKALVTELDNNAPDSYKQARQAWAGPSRAIEMMSNGVDFIKQGKSSLDIDEIKALPEVDKQFLRIGAKQAITDMVSNTPDGVNAVRRVFGNKMARDKLSALFKNRDDFASFAKTMENEGVLFENAKNFTGNSRTALRESLKDEANGSHVTDAALELMMGNKVGAARGIARSIYDRITGPSQSVSDNLPGMFSTDPLEQQRLLGLMRNRETQLLGSKSRRPTLLGRP